jgi:murein DD-endopeptidase MepM/ murein hydrolase activator NlpD
LAAGLSLAAGYAVAPYAETGRGQVASLRGQAVFGTINTAWDDGFGRPGSRVGADTTLIARGQMLPPIVAGTGPLRSGAILDLAPRNGVQFASLSWASVPAVPKPLTATEGAGAGIEGAVAARIPSLPTPQPAAEAKVDHTETATPVLETLAERMGVQGLGAQLIEDSGLFGKKKRSEPGRLPMSRSRSLDHVYSHAGDPLAVLQFDDDVPAPEYIMPFANGRVTSLFNQGRRHPAIDLAGKLGSPVLATTSRQKVVFAGWRGGYGNAVITQDVRGWTHLYGHLQSITARVGQMLVQGDKLGHLGSTGHSTGPHVHYEVKNSKGTHVNPVTLLFPGRGVAKGYAWLDVRQESALARLASRAR